MGNFLVIPNLYKGSALTEVSSGLINDIKDNHLNVKIIGFKKPKVTLTSGKLDDAKLFFDHSISVLNELKKSVRSGDKILFVDMFQLGLGLLHYFFQGSSKKAKYGSLLHGASFIENDFYKEVKWLKNFELGMVDLMQVIYTPSEYYVDYFGKNYKKKLKVIHFGFYPEKYTCNLDSNKKSFDVIIPHRWSWDKCPKFFYELAKSMPNIKFALCGGCDGQTDPKLKELFNLISSLKNVVNLGIKTGRDHYKNLMKAKAVVAVRDSFGYAFREAMACGCIPVLNNCRCYPEYIPDKYLFNDLDGAMKLIYKFVKDYPKDYIKPERLTFFKILEDFYGK